MQGIESSCPLLKKNFGKNYCQCPLLKKQLPQKYSSCLLLKKLIKNKYFSCPLFLTATLGVALVAIRAALLRPFFVGSDRLLIYILLDAVAVKRILPESAWTVALPFYYLAVAAFVLLTIRGFFRRNQKQYHKFLPRGEAPVGGKMVPQQIVA